MNKILFEKLPQIVSGRLVGGFPEALNDKYIEGVTIDSRSAAPGYVYIPVIGEKNDGHDFIEDALRHGASAVLSERSAQRLDIDPDELAERGILFVRVDSVKQALKDLAKYNRQCSGIPVVAITGSAGKTTTKDLIHSVLSQKYNTLKTPGNLNNEYGIPQTILSLSPEHEAAVIEMGMDHLHDIDQSIDQVLPQIAVITNIGSAHLEQLGSKENILLAKSEILNTLTSDQFALVNGDDPLLHRVIGNPFEVRRYGIDGEELDLKAENCLSDTFGIHFDCGDMHYDLGIPGIHNVYNALAAVWVGLRLGLRPDEIQAGFDAYQPSAHRMNIYNHQDQTIIDDSYNANPDSMKAALLALNDTSDGRRRVAILGDMLELGDEEIRAHLDVGRTAAKNADVVIGVGPAAMNILRGGIQVKASLKGRHFQNTDEAIVSIKNLLEPNDIILVKGSRGVKLDRLVDVLIQEDMNDEPAI